MFSWNFRNHNSNSSSILISFKQFHKLLNYAVYRCTYCPILPRPIDVHDKRYYCRVGNCTYTWYTRTAGKTKYIGDVSHDSAGDLSMPAARYLSCSTPSRRVTRLPVVARYWPSVVYSGGNKREQRTPPRISLEIRGTRFPRPHVLRSVIAILLRTRQRRTRV